MSNIVSALVQKRKVGSPTRKAILMFMASCASDDGCGVWTSKATMSRDLEMGKRTVQVSIDDLASQGLISETGTRKCANGFTIEYRLNLDAIARLELTNPNASRKPLPTRQQDARSAPRVTGAGRAPVQDMHPTGAGDAPQDVQEMHPNHPKTIRETVCAADAAQRTHPDFEDFWQAYPRPKDRDATELAFAKAVAEGADPDKLISAARAYRDENRGNGRMYLKHSANWLREGAWRDHEDTAKPKASRGDVAAFWAEQVKAGAFIPASAISPSVAQQMVEAGLVTPDDLKAVGVAA